MSQPPLTEQIQVLEQALQVKLFERSRRGTQLTPAGAAILPEVRKVADFLERLELTVREAARGQQGVLVIGAVTAAMMDVLPDLIRRLRQRHPRVTVSVKEIDSADAVPGLRAGEIDLALARLDEPPGPDIGTAPLRGERLAVALPAEHSLAARRGLELAQLAEEEFVMFYRRPKCP